MSAHAPLPPSGAPIWGHCSAYPLIALQTPDEPTEDSRRGDATHWVGAECLENFKSEMDGLPLVCVDWVGKTAPNGVVIDETMAEGAQIYVQDCLSIAQKHGASRSMMIEHKVHMPQIHTQNWGTLDFAVWVPDAQTLYVTDYKNGHREVRAEGNLQAIDYIGGLVNELQIDGYEEQSITVVIRIVQPFAYRAQGAVDEWICTLSDLRGYWNTLRTKAEEAMTGRGTLTTGLHCRDCPRVGVCAAARKAGYAFIDYADQPYEMDDMSAEELAVELKILEPGLKAGEARIKAIRDNLVHRIKNGDSAGTGLALESSAGNLAWTIEDSAAILFAKQFQIDAGKQSVLTPTQTIAKAPADIRPSFAQAIKSVARRPAGGLKLINASDSSTARAFKRK